jgi:glyceraldehyde 3-phosphate dehydrogenase
MVVSVKIGINGFGIIGRRFVRIARDRHPEFEVVAVNDLSDPAALAHLLKYDSTYGTLGAEVTAAPDAIIVDGKPIRVLAERDPAKLPWRSFGAEVVLEATGLFRGRDQAGLHITAGGAKKVIITAPGKDEDITIVMGVNDDEYDPRRHHIISNASCTTNCLAPVAKVLDERFGIVHGLMTTIHAYTNDQRLLDMVHKDLRRARAAALNIIPTTTGAAVAVSQVLPKLKGKLNGFALRVPVPTVSITDLVVTVGRDTTEAEVNAAMREAAAGPLKGILGVCEAPLVSSDFKGSWESAIVDAPSTMVVGGRMVKVVAWYDNEWAYSARLADLVALIAGRGM